MKKLIFLAMLGIALTNYQTAKAQVSLNINIGSQPRYVPVHYGYVETYRQPIVRHTYYAPSRNYVYVNRSNARYNSSKSYRSGYNRPANRYYEVKQVNYKNYYKANKNGKGHKKGKH